MEGILIFNSANDIVFKKLSDPLYRKIFEVAVREGLINLVLPNDEDMNPEQSTDEHMNVEQSNEELMNPETLENDIILQIFSPMVNSQKIMFCQFDNRYTSVSCDYELNITFGEFLGYSFLSIGTSMDDLVRSMTMCVTFTKHLCGPNLFILQTNKEKEQLLNDLIDYHEFSCKNDQGTLLHAMSQLITNSDIKNVVRQTLDLAVGKLQDLNFSRSHALMYVKNKFVGKTSSRLSQQLAVSDTLFILLLARTIAAKNSDNHMNKSVQIFLQGEKRDALSGCIPCIMNIARLDKGVILILIVEYGNLQVSKSIFDNFFAFRKVFQHQCLSEFENMKQGFDNLETCNKQTMDALKKAKLKGEEIELHKKFALKWETLKKLYVEYFRTNDRDITVRIESNLPGYEEELKNLFNLLCINVSSISAELEKIPEVSTIVEEKLLEFSEFLSVKADCKLAMEAYLREFPALIHFIFINRFDGIMIAPDHDANLIPKDKVWEMVHFGRSYLREGQNTIMWKDRAFHYSYFLWFVDHNSGALKTGILPNQLAFGNERLKMTCDARVLSADYYQYLTDSSFPRMQPGRIKCYELFCIHLGLVTATCVAEHCRRLVATIPDIIQESEL